MKTLSKKVVLKGIFPYLKLKDKNITWYKKILIYFEIVIMSWMILWILLNLFYDIFFTYKYQYENLTFYTNQNIVANKIFDTILNDADIYLKAHNIELKNLNANIYILNNSFLYTSTMIPFSQIFLTNSDAYKLFNSIYFKYVDIDKNMVYANSKKQYPSKFSIVLAHELVHIWQKNRLTYINFFMLPQWIKEGFPVYVSQEFDKKIKDKKDFITWVQNNKNKSSMSDFCALWGLMVKHAIEKMHKTVDELHEGKVEYDEVLNSLLKEYNITKEEK